MTDWVEDLKGLLGNVVGQENLPFDELAQGNWGGAATAPVTAAFNFMDLPLSMVKESVGTTLNTANMLNPFDEQGRLAAIARSREGGRAGWENFINDKPGIVKLALELGLDPTTYLGAGLVKKLPAGLRAGADLAEHAGQAGTMRGAASLVEGANFLWNDLPMDIAKKVGGPVARPVGRAVKGGIERVVPNAFEESPKTRISRKIVDVIGARNAERSANSQSVWGRFLPALPWIGAEGKSLAPLDEYNVPPFFDAKFDSGVSKAVKQKAYDAAQRMQQKYMSYPDIPGVNAAGVTPAQPGQASFMEGQRPGGRSGLLDRLRGSGNGPLGFVPPPPGGYHDVIPPGGIDEDNLRDMADIGLAAMLDFDNQNSNKMFAGILRHGPGFENVRRRIIQKYGAAIAPYLPAMYDQFRQMSEEQGIRLGEEGGRFLTNWGFPEGKIDTKRLDRIQGDLDVGKITTEQAFERVVNEFSKSNPEAIETAAGMGAGYLQAGRDVSQDIGANVWRGDFASPGIGANGRAELPEGFASQFDQNKESYNTYMRQLFGDLTDQELETLRGMSIESLYDEIVNAAGEFSAGPMGATGFLQKGEPTAVTDKRGVTRYPGYSGDDYTKIGTASDDPNAIANRETLPGTVTRKSGNPTLKQRNVAEAEKALGRPLTKTERKRSNAKIVQMIEEAGGKPYTYNTRGGPLANTQKLLEVFNAGKDIRAGDTVAQEWYRNAADEIMDVVGPGRYEDALMLTELMSVTSSGTSVEDNARNAIRAYSEWKLGSDDAIRNRLGLTTEQADQILNRSERWRGTLPPGADAAQGLAGDEMFMSELARNQSRQAGKVFEEFINRRSGSDPNWLLQGGPKTNNFAGSFAIKVWKDSVDFTLRGNEALRAKVQKALDDAATIYTLDRHQSRLSNQATNVTPMSAITQREVGIIASKEVPMVRSEDFQNAGWYWSKDKQGFLQVERNDDMANALRKAWNEGRDPALDARVRERLRELHPEWTTDELADNAEDIMRQEIVFAHIDDALKNEKRNLKNLTPANTPSGAVFELGNDVLGIVNRAGKGVMPRVKLSSQLTGVVSVAEKELESVQRGQSFGGTYKWSGDAIVPEEAKQGFAVALTSAGTALSTARRKTSAKDIERFLGKYADVLDDPTVSDNVRFGIFKMDDGASFDLSIVVPDEQAAIDLGRRHNQKSIFNLATGETIDVGGTGKPVNLSDTDLRNVITEVFGESPRDAINAEDVRKRGVTIDEMDSVNPLSILHRKVIKPLMKQYHEQSLKSLGEAAPTPGPRQAVPVPSPDPTSPLPADLGQIYPNNLLSTQENMLLSEDFEGETIKSRLDRYHSEATDDIAALDQSGVTWGPHTPLKERLKLAGDNEPLKKIIKKYADQGIDIHYATPEDVETHLLRRDMGKAEGIDFQRQTTLDLFRAAWGEQALFSPKYHLGNIQGAWLQNALGGTFRAGSPKEFLTALKLVRGGLDDISRQEAMSSLHVGQVAMKWGYDELPSYIMRTGGVRSMTSTNRRSGSAVGELVGRATKSDRLARATGKPFEWNADMSQAIEIVMRGSLWGDVLDREMQNAMNMVEGDIRIMADRQGLNEFEFSMTDNINPVPGGPSPKRLKDHLQNLGFSEGYAERAGRNFSEARNKAEKMAHAELDKRQFSYDRTNLDDIVGKVVPFHYWYSRAVRYYGEEALRHPYLVLNYMRANQGIEEAQNDPGLDARQKGFIKLMGTPLGFTLLMNPDALFGVVKVFGIDDTYAPDGQTKAGQVVSWLKNRGLGLYPWIDGTLNLMGTYGDTFEPDLLGIRHKAIIGAAVNFMRSQLGMDPAAAPYQTAMGQARWSISSFVSQFAPDWLSQPVLPKAGNNTTEATMDTLIESRVIANNQGLDNGTLLQIMSDPDSPEYNAAYKEVAAAGLAQQLLNFTAPQNYRIRDAARDVRTAKTSTIYEAAAAKGVTPQEFKPDIGDIEFATKYKNLTGKEWQPGDYNEAKAEGDITRATEQYKPFVVEEQQYYALGGPEASRIYSKYNDILNGKDPRTTALSDDERRTVAENWAWKLGYSDDIATVRSLRDQFEQTNPEFGAFKGWQDQMYSLSNHMGGTLAEYRRQAAMQNPNAARYFNEIQADVMATEPQDNWAAEMDRRTTNAAAYHAIMGLETNRYDPAPQPGVPMGDPTQAAMSPGMGDSGGFNPDYDWLHAVGQLGQGYGMNTQGTYWNQ